MGADWSRLFTLLHSNRRLGNQNRDNGLQPNILTTKGMREQQILLGSLANGV